MDGKNIALVGFMGSGKSSVAVVLAKRLGFTMVSTDAAIEKRQGLSISQIFEMQGEDYFRKLETEVLCDIVTKHSLVIDCGGGIVTREENLQLLHQNGIIVHLKASPAVIFARIKNENHRPLLNTPDPRRRIEELYNQRLPLYNKADLTVDADDPSVEMPIAQILAHINR